MKRCTGCGLEKPLDQYYTHRTLCNPCIVEKQRFDREYKSQHRSEVSEWLDKWGVPEGWKEYERQKRELGL